MVEVIVEFDYDAEHDDELTIKVGDIITNVRKLDEDGWLEGELNGKKGMFPDNFVKEIKKGVASKDDDHPVSKERSGNVANLVQRMSVYGLPAGAFQPHPHPKSIRRKSKKRQCRVLFEYIPQNEDELELKVGDVLEVNEEVEEGWWSGTLNGKSGLFPSNFVKEVEVTEDEEIHDLVDDADTSSKESPFQGPMSPFSPVVPPTNENGLATGSVAQAKKVRGVGFGDIFKEGSVKLKPRLPSSESEKQEKQSPTVPPAAKPSLETSKAEMENISKSKEYCKAVYSYEATNDDELSLKDGDIVLVLSKDTGEPGWWRGERNGKEGVFPDNFVTLIPEVERDGALGSKFSVKFPLKPVDDGLPGPKAPTKLPPKPDVDDKPKKPPPPAKVSDEKMIPDLKPAKPVAPMVPPKKPVIPSKSSNLLRPGIIPPKRPEKPLIPPPSSKPNGEIPTFRPKADVDILRPKQETEHVSPRPKSLDLDLHLEKHNTECDLISFDDLVSSSEKLEHLTASRPKMTGKRLPAQYTGAPSPTKEVPVEKVLKQKREDEENAKPKPLEVRKSVVEVHADKILKQNKEEEETAKPRPPSFKKSPASSTIVAADILKPNSPAPSIVDAKTKTEPDVLNRGAVEELKTQILELMAVVEYLKTEHRKELSDLRKEFEEEKKKRRNLEEEVEKLKHSVLTT
ncbi:CD2-associated protein isoform X2 [Protopterus annectens]|uniref:CD2-associated protein isoform X2 n=1 Tax=Protopterus annectens TaxID=7888 RepID=UPI001CFAACD0|nr:CD2-associated protein isoform X2 [Protopterus annectens]